MTIDRANQVWAADITYIPIGRGFLYLVAIMDWASRAVLAWRLSNTHGRLVLRLGAGGGAGAVRQAGDLQYRPGQPIHQRRLHRRAGGRRHPHLHGRPRPLDGQRVHRAAVAIAQARGRLSEGLCRWARGQGGDRRMDRLLQRSAPASGAGQPHADGGLARRRHRRARREGCGHDAALGQRLRVAHMPCTPTTPGNSLS